MSTPLPRRLPDGPFSSGAVLSVGAIADRVETVTSSLLATCGHLRGIVASWEARAGLLTDRAEQAEGERAVELRAEAETCKAHAQELRTVLNTGRRLYARPRPRSGQGRTKGQKRWPTTRDSTRR